MLEKILLGRICIWCKGSTAESDLSHVVPECFGNDDAHVLAKGIVCKACNNYFGTQVEPALIDDPLVHAVCVASRIVDPGDANVFRDRMFDHRHKTETPVERNLALHAKYGTDHFYADVSYSIAGKVRLEYNYKREAKFSRVLHKMAFENYVWLFVGNRLPQKSPDPLSERFDSLRNWARFGQPHQNIRPYIRMPAPALELNWEFGVIETNGELRTELRLYGDCFAVAMTTLPSDTDRHLREACADVVSNSILVGKNYELIKGHT